MAESHYPSYECTRNWLSHGSTCKPVGGVKPPPSSAPRLSATASPTYLTKSGKLRVHTTLAGGSLLALAHPARDPQNLVLSLRTLAKLDPAPCRVALFRDGVALELAEHERTSDHELRLAFSVADLRGLDHSARFAAELCGRELEIDRSAREALAKFAARFEEERVKIVSTADARFRNDK